MNIKIIDFGYSSLTMDKLNDYLGTQIYMAPEVRLLRLLNDGITY